MQAKNLGDRDQSLTNEKPTRTESETVGGETVAYQTVPEGGQKDTIDLGLDSTR